MCGWGLPRGLWSVGHSLVTPFQALLLTFSSPDPASPSRGSRGTVLGRFCPSMSGSLVWTYFSTSTLSSDAVCGVWKEDTVLLAKTLLAPPGFPWGQSC